MFSSTLTYFSERCVSLYTSVVGTCCGKKKPKGSREEVLERILRKYQLVTSHETPKNINLKLKQCWTYLKNYPALRNKIISVISQIQKTTSFTKLNTHITKNKLKKGKQLNERYKSISTITCIHTIPIEKKIWLVGLKLLHLKDACLSQPISSNGTPSFQIRPLGANDIGKFFTQMNPVLRLVVRVCQCYKNRLFFSQQKVRTAEHSKCARFIPSFHMARVGKAAKALDTNEAISWILRLANDVVPLTEKEIDKKINKLSKRYVLPQPERLKQE